MAVNALRVDFDFQQGDSKNWLSFSPYYYYDNGSFDPLYISGSEDELDGHAYEKMYGVGLGVSRKTFLSKEPTSSGFYLAYGGTYKYFDIAGDNFTWVKYTGDDGLEYQHMEDIEYSIFIHSMGAHTVLGFQNQIYPGLFINAYMGFGVKYSLHSSPEDVTVKYNRGIHDLGYTGTHFVGGLSLGIGIK